MVGLAQQFKTNYLQIQISVAEVTFSDGAPWKRGDPCPGISPDLVAVTPQGCAEWKKMKPSVLDVNDTLVMPSAESGLLPKMPTTGPGFATSCRILKMSSLASDRYTAVCPAPKTGSEQQRQIE